MAPGAEEVEEQPKRRLSLNFGGIFRKASEPQKVETKEAKIRKVSHVVEGAMREEPKKDMPVEMFKRRALVTCGNLGVLKVEGAIGKYVMFKRSNGQIQVAKLIKVNEVKDTLRVEWDEDQHTKVKDIDIAMFNELNTDGYPDTSPAAAIGEGGDGTRKPLAPQKMNKAQGGLQVLGGGGAGSISLDVDETSKAAHIDGNSFLDWFSRQDQHVQTELLLRQVARVNPQQVQDVHEAVSAMVGGMYGTRDRSFSVDTTASATVGPTGTLPPLASSSGSALLRLRDRRDTMAEAPTLAQLVSNQSRVGEFLDKLPPNVAVRILSMVGLFSLGQAALVCSSWKKVVRSPSLWELLCVAKGWGKETAAGSVDATGDFDWMAHFRTKHTHEATVSRAWRQGRYSVRTLLGHTGGVMCVGYDAKTDLIASGSCDGTLRLWSAQTGVCKQVLNGHKGGIMCLWLEDHTIVTGSEDKTLKIWTVGQDEAVATLTGHSRKINCVRMTKKTQIVSGSNDTSIRIWDMTRHEQESKLAGHLEPVTCIHISGRVMISGAEDAVVKVWDMAGRVCLHTIQGRPGERGLKCIAFDASMILAGSLDAEVKVFSLDTRQVVTSLKGHMYGVRCIHLDGGRLVTGSTDKTIKVWRTPVLEFESGDYVKVRRTDGRIQLAQVMTWMPMDRLYRVRWIDNGQFYYRDVDELTMYDLNQRGGECLLTLGDHDGVVNAIVSTGDVIVSGANDNSVHVYRFAPELPVAGGGDITPGSPNFGAMQRIPESTG
eukprot:Opistho-2@62737